MEKNSFYSKSIRVQSPLKNLGIAKITGGFILLIFSLSSFGRLSFFIEALSEGGSADLIINNLLLLFASIILFFTGLSILLSGFSYLKKITITPNDPPEFNNYNSIIETIIKGKLGIYRLPDYGHIRFAYNYISDRVPFLKPAQREVVAKNISFLRKYIFLVCLIVVIYFSQRFINEEIIYELGFFDNSFFKIPYFFMIVLLFLLIISFATIFYLVPDQIPRQEKIENVASVSGGGDPNQFCPIFERALYDYRFNSLPNRSFKSGFQKVEELSFNETGSYTGNFVIETHPKYIGTQVAGNVPYVYISIAIISLMISLFYFSYLPLEEGNAILNLNSLLTFFGGLILLRTSTNFFKRAYLLLNSFHFESIFTYIECQGTIGKTEITAGKAINDSIESRNVVIRSDSQFKVYATKIQSENKRISDERYVTAMIVDEKVKEISGRMIKEINNFRDSGVTIRGVDISSRSVSELTHANLKIQAAKKNIKNIDLIEGKTESRYLKDQSDSDPVSENSQQATKECPQCAETIKEKAKICRFCRYEFT
jgi:hypothetical protein